MATLAGQFNPEVILKQTDNSRLSVATGAQITVYEENGSTLATLYTDENKGATQANPVTIGGDGNLSFFTEPGEKVLSGTISGAAFGPIVVTVPLHPDEPGGGGGSDALFTDVTDAAYGALGDGANDDTAEIHAARDAAGAGGTVFFPPGTYMVSGLTLNAANQRWLLSQGATIKLINASEAPVVNVTADGVVVEGGTVDGNNANQTSADVDTGTVAGIKTVDRSKTTVRNVTVQNTKGAGIFSVRSSESRILYNKVYNSQQDGIVVAASTSTLAGSGHDEANQVIGNYVDRSMIAAASVAGKGIAVQGHEPPLSGSNRLYRTRVEGNIIKLPIDPTDIAVICIEMFGNCNYSSIIGNALEGGTMGVSISDMDWVTVSGNQIRKSTKKGIEVAAAGNGSIANNVIDGDSSMFCGIQIVESDTQPTATDRYLSVTGNRIWGVIDEGIRCDNRNVSITGNVIQLGGVRPGIWMNSAKRVVIAANTIYGDGVDTPEGILVSTSEDITITGNMIQNMLTQAVLVDGSTDVTIVGNNFPDGITGVATSGSNTRLLCGLNNGDFTGAGRSLAADITATTHGQVAGTTVQAQLEEIEAEHDRHVFKSGRYSVAATGGGAGTQALVNQKLVFQPIWISGSFTIDRIGMEVTTSAASSAIRLGIYSDDAGFPDDLLVDAGTIDSTTNGTKELTISQAVTAGRYWLAYAAQGGTPTVRAVGSHNGHVTYASAPGNHSFGGYQQTGVSGAFPTPATTPPTGLSDAIVGRVFIRVA